MTDDRRRVTEDFGTYLVILVLYEASHTSGNFYLLISE